MLGILEGVMHWTCWVCQATDSKWSALIHCYTTHLSFYANGLGVSVEGVYE